MATTTPNLAYSGITEKTPGNILLGAGTIYRDLKWDSTAKGWSGTVVGATSGGNKFSIKPTITQIEVDGAWVDVAQLDVKQGGTAELEINFIELSPEIVKLAAIAKEATTSPDGYTLLEDKPKIENGDYLTNIAFVGHRMDGKPIVVILDNAICTSGIEVEGKNKDAATSKLTFEARQSITGDLTTIPYHVYFPKVA